LLCIDIEVISKWIAHALIKHIQFSKGEILVDDLVSDDEDIPQFSYEFGDMLRIDLDEIQQQNEIREWEAEARNIENFDKLEYLMQGERYSSHYYQPLQEGFTFKPEFIYQGEEIPDEDDRIDTSYINDDLGNAVKDIDNNQESRTISIMTNEHSIIPNSDIKLSMRSSSQTCNLPLIHMNEMLQDHKYYAMENKRLMNSYYANLSMIGQSKPFFFPPPDLGMVESLGSFENSSKFFKSVMSTRMNRSIGKIGSAVGASIISKYGGSNNTLEDEAPFKNQLTETNDKASQENWELKNDTMNDVSVESIKSMEDNFLDYNNNENLNKSDNSHNSENTINNCASKQKMNEVQSKFILFYM